MLARAKQEGTSDVAYSRNQPSVLEDDREPQRQSGPRSGAHQTSNPKRIADSEDPGMRLPPAPVHAADDPLNRADGAGALFASTRVQKRRREPGCLSSGCRPSSSRKALSMAGAVSSCGIRCRWREPKARAANGKTGGDATARRAVASPISASWNQLGGWLRAVGGGRRESAKG